jgi:hypothetical protein
MHNTLKSSFSLLLFDPKEGSMLSQSVTVDPDADFASEGAPEWLVTKSRSPEETSCLAAGI